MGVQLAIKMKARYGYEGGKGLNVVNGWKLYDKPLKGKQFGFFATLKDGKFGEVTWGDEKDQLTIHHKRSFDEKSLFEWLHDNILIPFWGDMRIQEVKSK
jgi:hypothetical protein